MNCLQQELERLVLEQMCLAIRERGVTGALERKCESSDQQLERYKRRTETLHKQVEIMPIYLFIKSPLTSQ